MTATSIVPPLDYLRMASRSSLESFELARLNHAANLRNDIGVLIDQWIEETAEAMLARWMLEHYNSLRQPALPAAELGRAFHDPDSSLLPNLPESPVSIAPAPPHFAEPRYRPEAVAGEKARKKA